MPPRPSPLKSLMRSGGGQEFKQRSGTENVAGIVALAQAAVLAYHHLPMAKNHFRHLKTKLIEALQEMSPAIIINSPPDGLEHVVNASFLGIPSEVMMHSLEQKGIFVSAGSACSGSKREPSHVLKALDVSRERLQSAIRFSFSRYNTSTEVEYAASALSEIISELNFITIL
jgi:cysteine desulfurase